MQADLNEETDARVRFSLVPTSANRKEVTLSF
jgi:hypothetical protein